MLFIKKRIIEEANYIIKHNATLRETAKHFKLGKSTIHKDMNERLKNINIDLYLEIKDIMTEHIKTKHLKGGEATKKRYKSIKV